MTQMYKSILLNDTNLCIKRIPDYTILKNEGLRITFAKDSSAPVPEYPCGVCAMAVTWSDTVTAIACDCCDVWYHTECMGMSRKLYDRLNKPNINWICKNCNKSNYSSLQLGSGLLQSNNSFDVLADHSGDDSADSDNDVLLEQSSAAVRPLNGSGRPPPRSLRVLSANLGSMSAKRESFWMAVDSCDPDIIVACETWLKPDILNSEIMPPGYNPPQRKDRSDGYGGVLLATKIGIIANEIQIDTNCEILATKIDLVKQQPLIVVSVYRPTNNDLAYADKLCQDLRDIAAKYPSAALWVCGDFNLPDIDWDSDSISNHQYSVALNHSFLTTFHDLGLSQMVNFPTRQSNTLDLFLSNRPSLISNCVPLPGVSDHEMVFTVSNINASRHKPVPRKIHLWNKADPYLVKQGLGTFASSFLATNFVSTPVDNMWAEITNSLNFILNSHVPSKLSTVRFNQPWINRQLKRLAQRKKRAYKKAKKSNKKCDWSHLDSLKKQFQKESRSTYHSYIGNLISDGTNTNSKRFWSFIKSRRCENSGVAPLTKQGSTHSESMTKANILNDQFVSVFTNEDSGNLPDLGESPHPVVPDFSIDCVGVQKLLSNIKPHTAAGPDKLPAQLLRMGASELAPVFTLLFQATLVQGRIPVEWKSAHVTPIFKKGDKSNPSNYRPISLTSIVCKVMEHIIHSQIINHLDNHNLLTSRQFGFRKARSCESQLLLTVDDLARGLRDGEQIDAVLLDFSKAFDRVPHQRLLLKLHFLGVRGRLLSWIKDFLSGRTQRVILEGKMSSEAAVTSGVPQGTVLGPLLFLVFINDLPECVSSEIRLFADDCLLYRSIRSQDDAAAIRDDLASLQIWESKWLMSFNPDKCEVLRITNKRKGVIQHEYTIHGKVLRTVESAKYLGVTLSKNLNWKPHIINITKKANSTLGLLRRNLGKCPPKTRELAYNTYVRPTLEYASLVWDNDIKDHINRVESVQRRAARYVKADYRRQSSVAAMLDELHWAPLKERRAHAKMAFMWRIVNNLVAIPVEPPYLYPSSNSLRGHQLRFSQQHCRIQVYQQSFFPSAARLWNSLPHAVVSADSLDSFKKSLVPLTLS